jgi:hypothetical protein
MADMPDLAKVAIALGNLDEKILDLRSLKLWLARHGDIAQHVRVSDVTATAEFDTADGYRTALAALVGDGISLGSELTDRDGGRYRMAYFGKYGTLIVRGPA